MAIKETSNGVSWNKWPAPLRERNPKSLSSFKHDYSNNIRRHALRQFFFFRQWNALKSFSNSHNILIIGDIPIFVAYDSADVWANPDLFFLDHHSQPICVAGVPPDYFSPTGQLWGNPLYNWPNHKKDNYSWWKKRISSSLLMVDKVRLDHFRGFAGYWEIMAGMPTAEKGRWVKGPGEDFFKEILRATANLPLIAEDLGEITPDVIKLREKFDFPGMKILQFAFSGNPRNDFLPHNYPVNCVAYTGTHDNNTTRGWYDTATEKERDFCRRYLTRSGEEIAWDLIRAVWGSVAQTAIAPIQDFLNLGNEARMNYPSTLGGNWSWRMRPDSLSSDLVSRIADLNLVFGRSKHLILEIEKPKMINYQSPK
jgi:4-alpha-glucanotransferase